MKHGIILIFYQLITHSPSLNNRCDRTNNCALNGFNESLPEEQKIEIRQNKYLNNIIEQDHQFIKKQTKPMLGFKSFRSAKITIAGIENIRIIQKGQIIGTNNNISTWTSVKVKAICRHFFLNWKIFYLFLVFRLAIA